MRLSNCFGYPVFKNSNAWTLIANDLCRQAVSGNSLQIQSNINTQRDFFPIEALCKTVNYLLEENKIKEKQKIFNLGSGVSLTLFQLAKIIQTVSKNILGFTPSVNYLSSSNDPMLKPFFFRSKYIDMKNNSFEIAMEKEITMLIHHCKSEFIK